MGCHAQWIEGRDPIPIPLSSRIIDELLELGKVELGFCSRLVPLFQVHTCLCFGDAPVGGMVPTIASGINARLKVMMNIPPAVACCRIIAADLWNQAAADLWNQALPRRVASTGTAFLARAQMCGPENNRKNSS